MAVVTLIGPRGRAQGFTLVELLVVLAIIGGLAALITPMLRRARVRAKINSAKQEIQRLSLTLEAHQFDFGDYPPTDLESFYEVSGNGINSGIESLVGHLATRNKGGPYFIFKEEHLDNQDGDRLENKELFKDLNWIFGDAQLREYLDPWGNPYVYFHNRDYGSSFTVYQRDRKKTLAGAQFSEKTASYHSLTTFQIWSVGPNGKNENGEGDDLGSW